MSRKIMEESLKEYKQIKETLSTNAKEILRNTMSEEINGLIKESLTDDVEEEIVDVDNETELEDVELEVSDETSDVELEDQTIEPEFNLDTDEIEVSTELDATDYDMAFDSSEIDLTGETDIDKVFSIFKKLKDDDEIEIVSDKTVKLTDDDSGNEYEIRLDETNDTEEGIMFEIEMEDETEVEKVHDDEEFTFEIEMEDEDVICETDDCKQVSEDYVDLHEHNILKKKYETILNEVKAFQSKNKDYEKTLKQFKGLLNEAVLMNSNLAYVTKLFTENTTNFKEKKMIVERFDNEVKSLEDSKKLYKTIKNELSNTKVNTNKLNESLQSSKSIKLQESTTYVDEGLQKTLSLMKRINK